MTGGGFRTFSAGQVLAGADVQDYLMDQAVMNFAGTAARGSALPSPSEGMVAHVGGGTVTVYNGTAWAPLAGGRILQVVRATDGTVRNTTSTSYVDASLSVTITPQRSTSAILLIHSCVLNNAANGSTYVRITDNSDNAISGAEERGVGASTSDSLRNDVTNIGYATPGTTSATTFKARFRVSSGSGTGTIANNESTGQLYAIEVAA